jgi:hypothetical protein
MADGVSASEYSTLDTEHLGDTLVSIAAVRIEAAMLTSVSPCRPENLSHTALKRRQLSVQCWVLSVQGGRNTARKMKVVDLKSKAKTWPRLTCMCHIHSILLANMTLCLGATLSFS